MLALPSPLPIALLIVLLPLNQLTNQQPTVLSTALQRLHLPWNQLSTAQPTALSTAQQRLLTIVQLILLNTQLAYPQVLSIAKVLTNLLPILLNTAPLTVHRIALMSLLITVLLIVLPYQNLLTSQLPILLNTVHLHLSLLTSLQLIVPSTQLMHLRLSQLLIVQATPLARPIALLLLSLLLIALLTVLLHLNRLMSQPRTLQATVPANQNLLMSLQLIVQNIVPITLRAHPLPIVQAY